MTGRDAAAVLAAGAIGVQIGTALLCTPEAGTSAVYRNALLAGRFRDTIVIANALPKVMEKVAAYVAADQ